VYVLSSLFLSYNSWIGGAGVYRSTAAGSGSILLFGQDLLTWATRGIVVMFGGNAWGTLAGVL